MKIPNRKHLIALLAGLTALAIGSPVARGVTIYSENFETGAAPGFGLNGLWHVTQNYPAAGSYALGFVQAETPGAVPNGNYDIGNVIQQVFGPAIVIPAGAWQVAFDAFVGDEYNVAANGYDRLLVGVSVDGVNIASVIASSNPFAGGTFIPEWSGPGTEQFNHIVADVSAYAGQTIQLVFQFATLDDQFNNYPGVRVDNIAVETGNAAPVAVNDSASSNGAAVVINVLANDSDLEMDPISINGFSPASHGDVVNNGDGTLTYTPGPDYDGFDQFTYTITDGHKTSNAATVTIRNSAPLYKDVAVKGNPVPNQDPAVIFTTLSSLPDEAGGTFVGKAKFGKSPLGAIFSSTGEVVRMVGLLPGNADGASVASFSSPSGAACLAKLKTNTGTPAVTTANDAVVLNGLFTSPSVSAREGGVADGTGGLLFKTFTSVSENFGFVFFTGKLVGAAVGTDSGLWAEFGFGNRLAVRTGDTVDGKTVKTIKALVGISGSTAESRGAFTDPFYGGSLDALLTFTDSSQAIKNYYPIYNGVDYVVASQPVANTGDPIAPGVTLTTLGLPATSSENSSYLAKLAGTGINGKNNFALIVNGVIGLQKGAEAMSTGGAVFSSFKAPVAGALGSPVMPAFAGTNAVAVGGPSGSTTFIGKISGVGVLPATNTGIWTLTDAGQTLVARIGSPAPSTGGEVFKSFTTLADSNDGPHGPLFTAKLTLSANVTTLNSLGLWGVDVNGSAQLLARTGDTIPCNGAPRVLKNFIALKNATGSAGNGRGYDGGGHAFILASFLDGTIGLIRITAP